MLPPVAVVLLIDAVMFQQLGRVVAEAVGRFDQLGDDAAADIVALRLRSLTGLGWGVSGVMGHGPVLAVSL